MKIALVAIGYNRKNDYARLIESLIRTDYQGDKVDLIMSIDNSGSTSVEEYAFSVKWPFGEKIIKTYKQRQGLRKHIVHCGEFLEDYDAIAVFEDDIVASPAFYNYAKQCVEKYIDDINVAGISLYTHLQNVWAKFPFIPAKRQYDVYFHQIAQSWGQVWMKKQWREFKNWYELQGDTFEITATMPQQLSGWGKNSWLKYHIKYCIEKNKYFVFPYDSLTTCFSSAGEHNAIPNNAYQVPMCLDPLIQYKLPEFGIDSAVYYDVFFERQRALSSALEMKEEELMVDLYGLKPLQGQGYRYVLSSRVLPYETVDIFACEMRPQEDNIIFSIKGKGFALYDLNAGKKENNRELLTETDKYIYYHRIFANNILLLKTAIKINYHQVVNKLHNKHK